MKIRKKYLIISFLVITGMLCGQAWAQMMGHGSESSRAYGGGPRTYPSFTVETADDLFTSPESFEQRTGLQWVDDDNDGICDYSQNTELYREELGLEWRDSNNDGISDLFQTRSAYCGLGLNNFVDVDGDGICDNYEDRPYGTNATNNFRRRLGPQYYQGLQVDTAREIFINPDFFEDRTDMPWMDEDGDGISDYAQDTVYFQELGVGLWADSNNDTIADVLQSRPMYWALGMGNNFVDVNGDGLCDNYVDNPFSNPADDQQ